MGGGKRKFLLIVPLRRRPGWSSLPSSSPSPSSSPDPGSTSSGILRALGGADVGGEAAETRWGGRDWRLIACFCCVGEEFALRCVGEERFAWDMDCGRKWEGDEGFSPR